MWWLGHHYERFAQFLKNKVNWNRAIKNSKIEWKISESEKFLKESKVASYTETQKKRRYENHADFSKS